MAHLELDATPTGYVLHQVSGAGSQLLERFDTDRPGTRKLLATLHQRLDGDATSAGIVLAKGHDADAALRLRDAITGDPDASPALKSFAAELGRSGERMPDA